MICSADDVMKDEAKFQASPEILYCHYSSLFSVKPVCGTKKTIFVPVYSFSRHQNPKSRGNACQIGRPI
jgi:hypothetical protein